MIRPAVHLVGSLPVRVDRILFVTPVRDLASSRVSAQLGEVFEFSEPKWGFEFWVDGVRTSLCAAWKNNKEAADAAHAALCAAVVAWAEGEKS